MLEALRAIKQSSLQFCVRRENQSGTFELCCKCDTSNCFHIWAHIQLFASSMGSTVSTNPLSCLPCQWIGRSSVPLWSTLTNSSERDDKSKRKPMTSTTIWLWLQNNVFSPNRHLHVWVQFLVSGHRGELNICKHLRTFADQRDEGQWRHRWKQMIERNPTFRSITIAIGSDKGQEPETAYDKRSMLRQYCVM